MSDKDSEEGGGRQVDKLGAEPTNLTPEVARQLYDALRKAIDDALRTAAFTTIDNFEDPEDREILIRNAPPWVREAIDAIRATRGLEGGS